MRHLMTLAVMAVCGAGAGLGCQRSTEPAPAAAPPVAGSAAISSESRGACTINKGAFTPCELATDGQLNDCLPVHTRDDWELFRRSADRSRIRSPDDWRRCLADPACNPLAELPPEVAGRFTASIEFRDQALAFADYSEIGRRLTSAQLARLFDRLGVAPRLLATARCDQRRDAICLGKDDR